jgi:hypothetical protein
MTHLWSDRDAVELGIDVCDGNSLFSNRVYVAPAVLAETVSALGRFGEQVHGGLLDIRFGEFGPEYANGACHLRLHYARPGRLYLTCRQQSEFMEFSTGRVASEATLFLKSEPALFDRFVSELSALGARQEAEAYLEGV